MKNFFKKLSFVLAIAMVLTSVVPATTASAASKVQIELNGKAVTEVTAFFGGVVRNLDASKNGKAASGTWKVGNTKVATVDSKTGVITPVGEGTTKVAFTLKGEKKASASVYVKVRTRAAALHVYDPSEYATGTRNKLEDTTIELNVGEDKELKVTMPISKKASNAGAKISTYFLYAESSDEDVVKVSASTKMYTRAVTLKPVAAGEATVTLFANQTTKANARANKYVKEAKFTVKVAGESKIAKAEAKKVNVVEVTFNGAADKDTVIALSKAGNAVEHTVAWNEDRTVATLTTTAKMTKGTYQVTATVAEAKSETTFEVVSQYVKEIKILNDVALTGKKGTKETGEAYIYYVVLDQYGEDLTASTSIQWSTSAKLDSNSRSEGKLTVSKSDGNDFVYGEQVFVTGVYTKTGVNVNATLTIGAKQALNSIEMLGFVKKNTAEIVKTLPNGFKSNEYALVFKALDQNGNALVADKKYSDGTESTFVTDNVLLVYEVKGEYGTSGTVTIGGETYNAIWIKPGDFVDKGGEVNITAIATKTGNKVVKNFVVGNKQILTSFTMDAPSGILADDESWEIPFTALDQNGEKMTNFDSIANSLNELTFTTSGNGFVKLSENDDATATLVYNDYSQKYVPNVGWSSSEATDGLSRIVSVTSVVVGGNSDNLMMNIDDKARPDAIKDVALDAAYVEGATADLGFINDTTYVYGFVFLDQYGREMKDSSGRYTDNGFFAASVAGNIKGTEFADYKYDVVIKFKGDNKSQNYMTDGTYKVLDLGHNNTDTVTFSPYTTSVNSGNDFAFSIGRLDTKKYADVAANYEVTSNTCHKEVSVVDISQVRNFAVKDVKTLNVVTDASDAKSALVESAAYSTAAGFVDQFANTTAKTFTTSTQRTLSVTGVYNGTTVTIPADYIKVVGRAVATNTNTYGDKKLTTLNANVLKWSDFYDVKTANYVRKNAADVIKVVIANAYANVSGASVVSGGATYALGAPLGATDMDASVRDTVSKTVYISDAYPYVAKINAPDTLTVNPTQTVIKGYTAATAWTQTLGMLDKIDIANHYYTFGFEHWLGGCVVVDQYDDSMLTTVLGGGHSISLKVSNIKEAEGYADNNFTVSGNDSIGLEITGAEIGDTFTLTITADGVSKEVAVTVGADTNANIVENDNYYKDVLIDKDGKSGSVTWLEKQRTDALK